MSYPRDCPVARWAGDGRDYVIAPTLEFGFYDWLVETGYCTVEDPDDAFFGAWSALARNFTPRNAAARAVLAVARGGRR